jgi:hypothetical protein
MMLTKAQAMTEQEFHVGTCKRIVGPRGGVTIKQEIWRRNGQTQTWKTRPNEFRVPVKHGLYDYSQITTFYAHHWHAASECPLVICEGCKLHLTNCICVPIER